MDFQTVQSRPFLASAVIISLLSVIYAISLGVYRLYLHPLARFPGPKLAALSKWYEFYYEVVQKGQFTFHIQDLHRRYGPIIRVTPDEIHVDDPDFFDELYVKTGRADKYDWMSGRFGNENAVFTTALDHLHKLRRGPLNPLFSRKRIVDFQPAIQQNVDKLCKRLAQRQQNGRTFPLKDAWMAFVGDVITEYSFGRSYEHLDLPEFEETIHEPMMAASETSHLALQFPIVPLIMQSLPEWMVMKIEPQFALLFRMQRDLRQQIIDIKKGVNQADKDVDHPTIFHELLKSDLPASELTDQRLQEEAQVIVAAGVTTTGWALTVASFHIINSPQIFNRLRAELEAAMPDPDVALDWQKLEQLPYLTGCIREGIRLSYGVSARNPRLSPKVITYKDWVIPPRTPVSMTIVDINHNEAVFPDSNSFLPERWLNNPKTANGQSLDHYFVGFGKGSRSCLGINLAYAELHLGLAAIFRRFEFELFETDVSDVVMAYDCFIPQVKLDSKGVRVKVKA